MTIGPVDLNPADLWALPAAMAAATGRTGRTRAADTAAPPAVPSSVGPAGGAGFLPDPSGARWTRLDVVQRLLAAELAVAHDLADMISRALGSPLPPAAARTAADMLTRLTGSPLGVPAAGLPSPALLAALSAAGLNLLGVDLGDGPSPAPAAPGHIGAGAPTSSVPAGAPASPPAVPQAADLLRLVASIEAALRVPAGTVTAVLDGDTLLVSARSPAGIVVVAFPAASLPGQAQWQAAVTVDADDGRVSVTLNPAAFGGTAPTGAAGDSDAWTGAAAATRHLQPALDAALAFARNPDGQSQPWRALPVSDLADLVAGQAYGQRDVVHAFTARDVPVALLLLGLVPHPYAAPMPPAPRPVTGGPSRRRTGWSVLDILDTRPSDADAEDGSQDGARDDSGTEHPDPDADEHPAPDAAEDAGLDPANASRSG